MKGRAANPDDGVSHAGWIGRKEEDIKERDKRACRSVHFRVVQCPNFGDVDVVIHSSEKEGWKPVLKRFFGCTLLRLVLC